MKNIKVCVDVDETIAASLRCFLRHIGEEKMYEEISSYDLNETIGEESRNLYLKFIESMPEEVDDYCSRADLTLDHSLVDFQVVSSRSAGEIKAFERTHYDWFNGLNRICDGVGVKKEASGDVLIDDWPCEEFARNFKYIIVIDRPWNRGKFPQYYRAKDIKGAINLVKKMIASSRFVMQKV